MTRLAVITPSYEPDFGLCEDLSRSVLENSPETVHHHIIVPRRDLELFARLAGPRTHIRCEADFLPSSFVPMPFSKFTVNFRRPFPPVRGWILQQVLKLAAAAAFREDAIVLVDSDIEFIRPFTPETFVRQGVVRFYRNPNAVDERLPRHMIWHRVARALLGLPPPGPPPYPNYISSLLVCGSGDRSPNAFAHFTYNGAPMADRCRRPTALLRVDALRGLRGSDNRRPSRIRSARMTRYAMGTGRKFP